MKPEIKKKWIEALRSGNYKQSCYVLRDKNAYCCLGVLCDVVGCKWDKNNNGVYIAVYNEEWDYSVLPKNLSLECEISNEEECKLTLMNDCGADFIKIANYIEEKM